MTSLLIKTLTAPPPESKPAAPSAPGELRRVYLICDAKDEQDFVGMHQENLKLCDGILIYFGQASAQWAEMKLMDLLKAQGFGREKPWLSQAVYLAPPDHRRKGRFRSHQVDVIREQAGFNSVSLTGFVAQMKSASGGSP